jgi:hypothetical protein
MAAKVFETDIISSSVTIRSKNVFSLIHPTSLVFISKVSILALKHILPHAAIDEFGAEWGFIKTSKRSTTSLMRSAKRPNPTLEWPSRGRLRCQNSRHGTASWET